MKRCTGGIRGGIATYTLEKSYYKSVGWIYTIGGHPLRHPATARHTGSFQWPMICLLFQPVLDIA